MSTFIVAELSANHNNSFEIAKETIVKAAECGADAVKIQTYTADTMTIKCDNSYFKINNGSLWDGKTYYELYEDASMPWDWYLKIKKIALDNNIQLFSSPFDSTSVDFLESCGNPIYKIASFEIADLILIEKVASLGKPIIISTGVATIDEIYDAVIVCKDAGNFDITLLECSSSYPSFTESINLNKMKNMKETFGVKVGLSDHSLGPQVAIAAVAMGATIVEKHFILDRKNVGPDSSFSIEPKEFAEMVSSIRSVEKALKPVSYDLDYIAKANQDFRRSLFVVENIKCGDVFSTQNLRSIRPGFGLSPKYYSDILGKKANIDIALGTPMSWDLVSYVE
ncbi:MULTISPECIES: pseudaminic acid synthase [unclassified Oceanispirochaeta]|uniref:pseudaminic acid synthase n=1 Tax=unclassified Oceanispirochaeta TaxID=2635722 RepID=UPI000E09CC20|nr:MULTISPECIES: pseudaminic acid synthase [unclassified Oceanispirochaeta]MBF9018679.1 pseudaminic acid synthase [Oceanispirochaeta sp. M2]NPD75117.1 pseudaminic acid synthase [Oceanispirochaeta sp. M1]RDG29041.1 pseudaminic acid synthase [Oceanispirochaeta sp. M1]